MHEVLVVGDNNPICVNMLFGLSSGTLRELLQSSREMARMVRQPDGTTTTV